MYISTKFHGVSFVKISALRNEFAVYPLVEERTGLDYRVRVINWNSPTHLSLKSIPSYDDNTHLFDFIVNLHDWVRTDASTPWRRYGYSFVKAITLPSINGRTEILDAPLRPKMEWMAIYRVKKLLLWFLLFLIVTSSGAKCFCKTLERVSPVQLNIVGAIPKFFMENLLQSTCCLRAGVVNHAVKIQDSLIGFFCGLWQQRLYILIILCWWRWNRSPGRQRWVPFQLAIEAPFVLWYSHLVEAKRMIKCLLNDIWNQK